MPSNKIDIPSIREDLLKNKSISIPFNIICNLQWLEDRNRSLTSRCISRNEVIDLIIQALKIPEKFIVISFDDYDSLNLKISITERKL